MNDKTQATETSDAELRALWQQAGGTIYSNNSEIGSMPTRKLLPFLRQLMGPEPVVIREHAAPAGLQVLPGVEVARAAPAPSAAHPDSGYAAALVRLVDAVCPGLDTGNLLEDARKATEALQAGATLVGHFGIDDEPATDGSARYLMVGAQHAGDPDVFPLYRCARLEGKPSEAATGSSTPGASTEKTPARARGQGGKGATS